MILAGLQKTTLVDYPGKVAATVFTRGCNFACGFCHNPELVIPAQFAPQLPTNEFFDFLRTRQGKLDGVCITGGEPTLHADLPEFITAIKEMGFLVKLDTNGSNPDRLHPLLQNKLVDYVAMDIKGSPAQYQLISRARPHLHQSLLENIDTSIALIMTSGVDYEFRTTTARQLHTAADYLEIGLSIIGARRYWLQNYVPSKQIDASATYTALDDDELMEAKSIIGHYVDYVGIR